MIEMLEIGIIANIIAYGLFTLKIYLSKYTIVKKQKDSTPSDYIMD